MDTDKVLVVDDDEGLLHLTTIALRRSGYEVESAGDGLKALEILRSRGPLSVLLTDLVMPGMGGQELVQVTRQLDPSIEVIVITSASTLESALSTLRKNGAYHYLLKPLESMNQLAVVVERALRHRQLVQERLMLAQSRLPAVVKAPVLMAPYSSLSRALKIGVACLKQQTGRP